MTIAMWSCTCVLAVVASSAELEHDGSMRVATRHMSTMGMHAPRVRLLRPPGTQGGATVRVGVIESVSGRPIAAATTTLTEASRQATTDAEGRLVFRGIPAGPQHLQVRRLGYAPRTLHLLVGREGTVDVVVVLTPLATQLQRLTIEREPPVALRDLDGDRVAAPGERVVSAAAIRSHPMLAEPDPLLAVAGGVAATRPEMPGGLHVMGGSSDQMAYFVDDVPILSPYHAAGAFSVLDAEGVRDMTLQLWPRVTARTDAIGGAIEARTAGIPEQVSSAGALSPAQGRIAWEHPLGRAGGVLVTSGATFPGLLGPPREASHLRGNGADLLGRIALPLDGGELRVLAFAASNDQSVAARTPDLEGAGPPEARSELEWSSRSLGASWTREGPAGELRRPGVTLSAWHATAGARADWRADSSTLVHEVTDVGVMGIAAWSSALGVTTLALRMQRRASAQSTARAARLAGAQDDPTRTTSSAVLATVRGERRQHVARTLDVALAGTAWAFRGRTSAAPSLEVTVRPSEGSRVSVAAEHREQFMQSARNTESLLGTIFPADLWIVAGGRVPVARSDQVQLHAEWRPSPSQHLAVRGWVRVMHGLALPASGADGGWAEGTVSRGDGRMRGVSVEGAARTARVGVTASVALQSVQLTASDTSYAPEHGATHMIEAGLLAFPQPSLALRLAGHVAAGRRATPWAGSFEWESCNLLDWGCEYAAGPVLRDGALGSFRLPAYVRVDAGVRKHWHLRTRGRDLVLTGYATVTNLTGRRNVLTVVRDPGSGRQTRVTMRPRAPLALGLEWRF